MATSSELMLKVTWSRLGLGREGGVQLDEEGNRELTFRTVVSVPTPPVSRILLGLPAVLVT